MMTEIMFVEGVSDVQLISYFLQNVYGWKHEKANKLRIVPLDEHEHIESLSKDENQLICIWEKINLLIKIVKVNKMSKYIRRRV